MKPTNQNTLQNHVHRTSATAVGARWIMLMSALLLAAHFASAGTYTWTNTATGAYNNPLNWDLNAVPGSLDLALIYNNGTAAIDSTMNLGVSQLLFGSTVDASSGSVTMSGGSLWMTNNVTSAPLFALGYGAGSSGTFSMTNGTVLLTNTSTAVNFALGYAANSSGTFIMGGGNFIVTNNNTANIFFMGNGQNSTATFTMNGGTCTIARPSASNRYYQDGFDPGQTLGSTATLNLNAGVLNILCGMEMGLDGAATINVNGGQFVDNGWFTIGKGGNATGSAVFNQTGGTVFKIRNPNGSSDSVRIGYGPSIPGTLSISGGSFYCDGMHFVANNAAGTVTLNVSGGNIYVSEVGITAGANAGSVKNINISGGTFGSVYQDQNFNGNLLTNAVHPGIGTNWTWASANMPAANLNTSPGSGTVTFSPGAGYTITLANAWTGAGGMAIGAGTTVFGVSNAYAGSTTINAGGTLQLNANQPSSLISGTVVASGGTLLLATAEVSSAIGAATFNGGSTLNLGTGAAITDSTFTIPSGGNLVFSANNTQYLPNNVAGAGNVSCAMSGNGMEVVTGTLGHSGSTTVTAGILDVGGTLNSSSGVLVTNNGTLAGTGPIGVPVAVGTTVGGQTAHVRTGISPMNVPGTLTVNNLTLNPGSELDVKLGTATTTGGGVNDLLVVQGNLTIDPTAVLNILPMQALTAGTYVIATYAGALTGNFAAAVGSLSRYGFSIDYSTTNQIKLNVTGSDAGLTWLGTTNNNWDVLTTSNWLNGASVSAFAEADAVTFDDTSTNHNVVVASTVYPASITFNNNSNFSLTGSGSGRISGATGITKNGTGTVLMAAGLGLGNDFTGPVNINSGIFKMNGALSLGATNGATTVASGATLDINGQTPNAEPISLQGAGIGGTNYGAINNTGGQPDLGSGPRRITLLGDTSISAFSNRWDMGINTLGAGGGSFAGNGFKLTKNGVKDIWLHELGDIGVGDILVNQGTLGFEFIIGLGNAANTITVSPGATFGIWQAPTLTKQVVLNNGGTLYSDGASNALSGTITLNGANTFLVNQPIGILSPMVGTGGFQKTGAGALYLPAANIYSGATTISAGNLILGPSGSIANSTQIALGGGTLLDASQPGSLTLSSGQTLSGSGSVNGNVSAGTGTQIAPGTATAAGTLTFNNNLTLSGDTNLIKLGSDPTQIGNGVNDLMNVTSALSLSGTSAIQVSPLGVLNTVTPYTVMQYGSGSPTAANFHVTSSSPRYNVTLVDPTTTTPYIQVTLTGNPAVLVWKGGATSKPNIWDNLSTNWLNLGTSLRDAYFGGDQAILDDTGTTNNITLNVAAVPLITLSNSAKAYSISGNGTMSGTLDMENIGSTRLAISNAPAFSTITANAGTVIYDIQGPAVYTNLSTISDNGLGQSTITKAGTNTMIMSAPDNSGFTGSFVISNGVMQYTNASSLGGTGSIFATNTGSLDINAIPCGTRTVVISGNGYNGLGAIIDSSPNQIGNVGVEFLTLTGDASISAGTARWDVNSPSGSTVNGNGYKLTHLSGVVLFGSVAGGVTGLGDIHIVGGRLGFQGLVDLGDPSKTVTIESNATMTFFDVSPAPSKTLVMNGSLTQGIAVFDSGGNGAGNTFNGSVTLAGPTNLFGLRKNLALEGAISGIGGMTVGDSPVGAGAGTLNVDASGNTYSGPTTINSGHSLVVGVNSSLGSSSRITVNSGGILDVSAPATFTLGAGQTLLGAGTVNGGNVVIGSGATLEPGFPDNNTYTLTMNGTALTLQAGSTNLVVVKKTTGVANDTVSGLTLVAIGGTLVVNNVGNALAANDAIPLFSAGSYSGTFSGIIPATPGASLGWNTNTLTTDGMLRVAQTGPPTTPTNIVVSVSANVMSMSWPSNYIGWRLEGQTNPPGHGITSNWGTVPGSTTTNLILMPIDKTVGSMFFRMVLP